MKRYVLLLTLVSSMALAVRPGSIRLPVTQALAVPNPQQTAVNAQLQQVQNMIVQAQAHIAQQVQQWNNRWSNPCYWAEVAFRGAVGIGGVATGVYILKNISSGATHGEKLGIGLAGGIFASSGAALLYSLRKA